MYWVDSDGQEHVMISRDTLDVLLEALDPAADDEQRKQARQLLIELDEGRPSRKSS